MNSGTIVALLPRAAQASHFRLLPFWNGLASSVSICSPVGLTTLVLWEGRELAKEKT
jgi:hypothetical protein